ncbi:hypothetical protein [Lactonifactor longoviformis]|uniref:hypothetical protein n=1 Tax=Lactonifactor longoviformis TaxID=341220 RepID=UPI001D02BF4E|nr:hypothetical protein [Lactonifactor longoviformis]MCB5712125.1 hypothetical protein [Lactonifactor longoviformis]MCB5716169.1 hypothetical protein [Lactonifactor longoviformis]
MKLEVVLSEKATVITKKETPYEFDGRKGMSYSVNLLFPGLDEVEKFAVSEGLYRVIERNKSYLFSASINTSYKNKFILERIVTNSGDGLKSSAR